MEFNEKLQELRKQKGWTQEDFAQRLYVSRTAVSKWESGRGYPNIESLKAIAKEFSVTIDELLSGDELLTIAQEDKKQNTKRICNLVFGLLDLSAVLFFFLPLFGQKMGEGVQEVSLWNLTQVSPYLRTAYFVFVAVVVLWGVFSLLLQSCSKPLWVQSKSVVSLSLSVVGVLVFVVSMQPYSAVLLFVFLLIKVLMLIKWR